MKSAALSQLKTGIDGLLSGLKLLSSMVEGLAVRAPSDGQLADFQLQVVKPVNTGKRKGRIDDPKSFKLAAHVDEFYLRRVSLGQKANAKIQDK